MTDTAGTAEFQLTLEHMFSELRPFPNKEMAEADSVLRQAAYNYALEVFKNVTSPDMRARAIGSILEAKWAANQGLILQEIEAAFNRGELNTPEEKGEPVDISGLQFSEGECIGENC